MPISAGHAYVLVHPKIAGNFKTSLTKQVRPSLAGLVSPIKAAVGGVIGGALVGAFLKAAGSASELGGRVKVLTRELGVSAEQASRYAFIAHHFGIETETLSRSFGIFAKHLQANDKAVAAYGISLKDAGGKTKPFNTILQEVSDRFRAMPDGVEKTALALNLFGRGGKALIPILNQGGKGLAELGRESDKFGLTLTGKNLEALKRYKFAQRDLSAALQGFQVQIGLKVVPALTKFIEVMGRIVGVIDKIPGPVLEAGVAIGGLTAGILLTNAAFKGMRAAADILTAIIKRVGVQFGVLTVETEAETVALEQQAVAATTASAGLRGVAVAAGIASAAIATATIGIALLIARSNKLDRAGRQAGENFLAGLPKGTEGVVAARQEIERLQKLVGQGDIFRIPFTNKHFFLSTGAEDRTQKVQNEISAIQEWVAAQNEAGDAADGLGPHLTELSVRFANLAGADAIRQWEIGTIDALNGVKGSLRSLAGQQHLTVADIKKTFQENLRTAQRFASDWKTVVPRLVAAGATDLTKELQDMGLEGASIVHALAGANEKDFRKITADWVAGRRTARETSQDAAGSFDNITGAVVKLTDKVDDLTAKLLGIPNQRTINLDIIAHVIRQGSRTGEAIVGHGGGLVEGPGRVSHFAPKTRVMKFHAGGDVPAVLQTGEFVLRRQAVAQIGVDRLTAMNRGELGGGGLTVNVYVQGAVLSSSPEDLARRLTPAIRKELLAVGIRNGGTDRAFRRTS